ncbi:cell surface glycoprotein MUC18-like isoform X2 [Erpetoichthys calabaricus]|uniref:cell surface glycoprotein MUC18-like isoform X2 n=1 Tax=Erpetoichthys calabaricus TaxID=27687 RepID=UPI0010A09215|nr:cell surface glycoprotein MUC18-like isoform X2 [Erpetoichthys calabaricus]
MALRTAALMQAALGILLTTLSGTTSMVTVSMKEVVKVLRGTTANIPCEAFISEETNNTFVQWFIMGPSHRERIYYMGGPVSIADNGTEYTNRISMSQDYTLTIRDVTLQDHRVFFCQVGAVSAGNGESRTELLVFAKPEPPEIEGTHTGISVLETDPSKIATCTARNGYPSLNITWYQNQRPFVDSGNVATQVTKEASGLFTVTSSLYYKVTKEDINSAFYCEVSYLTPEGESMMESEHIRVDVYYPVENVKLTVDTPSGAIKEGDMVTLRCHGDGNPELPYSFARVMHDDQEEDLFSEGDTVVLPSVTRADGGIYRCKVFDFDQAIEIQDDVKIDVNFMDPIVLTPGNLSEVDVGKSVTVACNALSSGQSKHIFWSKDGTEISNHNNLTLQNVSFESSGLYTCAVSIPDVPGLEETKSIQVTVRGKPILDAPADPIEGHLGTKINLTCRARGFPEPKITWQVAEGTEDPVHKSDEKGVSSSLPVVLDDDLQVSCVATNSLGSAEHHFSFSIVPDIKTTTVPGSKIETLKKESKGVIIVGIIVGILLLAILGSVLYFLYKKGKIACGRSGKQEITRTASDKDGIVMEMKTDKAAEEAGLLQGVNGAKQPPGEQTERYIDLRN